MIAGPNGSGKSTLVARLRQQGAELGEWLNADEIASARVAIYSDSLKLLPQAERIAALAQYWETASREAQHEVRNARADAARRQVDFAFETVMSHPSHIAFLQSLRSTGFRTRLFFVCTDRVQTNVGRVMNRVLHGGHDVPVDRIEQRYHRCLALLPEAIGAADDVMVYDNSAVYAPMRLVAIIRDGILRHGQILPASTASEVQKLDIPAWWRETLEQIKPDDTYFDGPIA